MEKEQVVSTIEQLSPWFHKIELAPYGISTKYKSNFGEDADHPLPTWSHVKKCFPADLTGKTVLDIGCNAGFYSFEARKRNASAVLGVDARSWHVRQARFVRSALGLDRMDFRRQSLYELDPLIDGQFDVVLALGLVYHLKHLILGLENLFKMTRETLILESAVALPDMASSASINKSWFKKAPEVLQPVTMNYGGVSKEFMPLFYVKNDAYSMEAAENWFLPSAGTLVGMLQDVGFGTVEHVELFGGRVLIKATKSKSLTDSTRPNWLKARYELREVRSNYAPGEPVELDICVTNEEFSTWLARGVDEQGKGQVNLAAVLTSDDNPLFHRELPRAQLPRDIQPGQACDLRVCFDAPQEPGRYSVELDMVAEHVSFFQDLGSSPKNVAINVV